MSVKEAVFIFDLVRRVEGGTCYVTHYPCFPHMFCNILAAGE